MRCWLKFFPCDSEVDHGGNQEKEGRQEDDTINLTDLKDFAAGKPLTVEVVHADGTIDTIMANHTYNEAQIEWFKAGSSLNLISSNS